MTVFLAAVLACSACTAAGWHYGRRFARTPAPVAAGFVFEVYQHNGLVMWRTTDTAASRDVYARGWFRDGFVVMVYDPGDDHKQVVHGAGLLEEWETVWAVDA